jgi:hypothetical protein
MPKKSLGSELSHPEAPLAEVKIRNLGPDVPDGIRVRRRQLCMAAESGNVNSMREVLEVALRLSAEIDINTETSLDRIAFASLINPLKYLLSNETAMLAAFGYTREAHRPKSKRIEQRDLNIARDVGLNLAAGCAHTEAVGKAAEANGVSERTAQRAYERHRFVADIVKIVEQRKKPTG